MEGIGSAKVEGGRWKVEETGDTRISAPQEL